MPYHQVTGRKLMAQIMEHFTESDKEAKKALKWVKSYGGETYLTSTIYEDTISGIVSDKCPGPEWCSLERSQPRWWRPRRTKEGKAIAKEMESFKLLSRDHLQKLVKYSPSFFTKMGYRYIKSRNLFVFETRKGDTYKPPVGVKRITDIAFEKLTKGT